MRDFQPRPYQRLAVDHLLDVPRGALWAGMGMGKTVSTLAALDALALVSSRPTLVLAPLRVARDTWPASIWASMPRAHAAAAALVGNRLLIGLWPLRRIRARQAPSTKEMLAKVVDSLVYHSPTHFHENRRVRARIYQRAGT